MLYIISIHLLYACVHVLSDRFTPARGRVTVLLEQPKCISETRPVGLASTSYDEDVRLKSALSSKHKYTPLSLEADDSTEVGPTISYKQSSSSHEVASQQGAAGLLRIHVTDTGAGISKQHQAKLFSPYIQFNAGKLQKGQGSGLGLWISRSKLLMHCLILLQYIVYSVLGLTCICLLYVDIVEMHGGSLYVTSQGEGYGCTFTIELPVTITTTSTPTATTDNTRVTTVSEYHDLEVSLSGRERERGHTYGYLTGPDAPPIHSSKSIYSGYSLPSPHYTSGGDHTSVESESL